MLIEMQESFLCLQMFSTMTLKAIWHFTSQCEKLEILLFEQKKANLIKQKERNKNKNNE